MQVKPLKIGKYEISDNLLLAPMAGYTDYAFRHTILPLGVSMCYTELVSAKGLYYGANNSNALLYCGEDIKKTSAQIFGSETYFMRWACESEYLKDFDVIDINMGCPVPKVYKNGEGSALLGNILRAEDIVKECVKSGKTITLKIRTGLKAGDDVATDFAKMAENAGASMITIHGRVRENYYSGEIDYDAIYRAKKSVSIPVIANGGIFTKEDADRVMDRTGADGVMIARGAIDNPFIFCDILGKTPNTDLKCFVLSFLRTESERIGEKRTCIEFRKFVPCFFKGIKDIKEYKADLMRVQELDEIYKITDKIL